ncbi:MAG: V-type ATP synthase subunit E [Candidatus Diapherotrites archaeon]|nr:V-type ATP synthase subunit E [Candidatus Diapherotrites archaeon]
MQTFGDVERLKEAIKKKYDAEISAIQRQTEEEIRAIQAETKEKIKLMAANIRSQAEREAVQAESKVLSEERLKAKREFEKTREQLIEKTFSEIRAKLASVAHSKRYLNFIKKKLNEINLEHYTVIADSSYYKTIFPNYTTDKNIIGVKLVSDNMTYDLTLDTALEAKKDELRLKISELLW